MQKRNSKIQTTQMERISGPCGPNPISTKPFWKRINRLRNSPESSSIPTLRENGQVYKTDQEKANKKLTEKFHIHGN